MKVLRIKPMCRPEVIDIDGSLESLQKEVGGLIQATYPWDDKVALIRQRSIGMKKSMELYMNAAGWVIGLVGAGYAIGVHCKMNALAKKLDSKIDRLADDAAIQIPDYIIKDAVDKAVVNRTDYAIQRATNAAITDIHAETARQVKSAINKEYVTLQGSVKKEIKDQLGRIDISDLREEVKDEAKNQLAESMEDILEDFNDNLKNVKKIYGSISGGKETVVKIS